MKYSKYVFGIVIINWFIITFIGMINWPTKDKQLAAQPVKIVEQPLLQQNTPANSQPVTESQAQPTQVIEIQEPAISPIPSQPKCLVTIEGRLYDVEKLKNTHSGGNIFVCDSDMTNIYFSQHDSILLNGAMQQYLVQ